MPNGTSTAVTEAARLGEIGSLSSLPSLVEIVFTSKSAGQPLAAEGVSTRLEESGTEFAVPLRRDRPQTLAKPPGQ